MEAAYLKIAQRLMARAPEVKYIDWDVDQLDNPEAGYYPPAFPCVLISIVEGDPQSIGENLQEIDLVLAFRIAFIVPENMNSLSPLQIIETGLERFKITKKVHKALQGFIGDNFNALDRNAISQENHPGGVLAFIYHYQTLLADNSAIRETDTKVVELVVNVNK